jgi:hypothetical protein
VVLKLLLITLDYQHPVICSGSETTTDVNLEPLQMTFSVEVGRCNQSYRFSWYRRETLTNAYRSGTPSGQGHLDLSNIDRLARTLSIIIRIMEEQQIRVSVEFEEERERE